MCAHGISCSSFQFSRTVKMVGSDRKYGCSDIVDTFSPTFRNPIFRFSSIVKYESLDNKKSEIFTHPSFRYLPIDFQTFVFSIFVCSQMDFKNPRFSNIRLFNQYSLICKYENLDHKNPRFLNVQQNIQLF